MPAQLHAAAGVAKTPTGPCKPTASASLMSLYNPGCTTCSINNPPVQPNQPFYFAASQPYASKYLVNGKCGTQVGRCSRSASYGVGSCLGRHTGSQGAACEDADFSFMLSRAQPAQQWMLLLMGHPSPPKH